MRQIGDGAAVAQDEDPVGAFDDLFELRGNHQHAEALVGEFLDQRLNLGLGADVDAAGRFVEREEDGSGSLESPRPSSTFCWLPPLRLATES